MSIVRTFGTDGCVNWSSIDPISRVVVRPQSCGVASLRSGNIHVADRGFGKAYDSSPFENKMAAIGSGADRRLSARRTRKADYQQTTQISSFKTHRGVINLDHRCGPTAKAAKPTKRPPSRSKHRRVNVGHALDHAKHEKALRRHG